MGRIRGTAKSETIYGTKRDDTIYGEGGDDTIFGGVGNDYIRGGTGNDILHGEDGNDTLVANEGTRHELYGGAGDDLFSGGLGYDLVDGGTGNDTLHGGAAADDLYGGAGSDTLHGETGADNLYGGDGADRFYYSWVGQSAFSHPQGTAQEIGVDTIYDFNVASGDWLDLRSVDADENTTGDQNFVKVDAFTGAAGQLTLVYDGTAKRTVVSADSTGDGVADLVIYILGDVSAGGDWLVI